MQMMNFIDRAITDGLALYNETYDEFWAHVTSYIEQNKD